MVIDKFSLPATDLPHPAITVCKNGGRYDVGEYLRAVFDNFDYRCPTDGRGRCAPGDRTDLLRKHFDNLVGNNVWTTSVVLNIFLSKYASQRIVMYL